MTEANTDLVQLLHGECVAGGDTRDGEHAHRDSTVEGPDEAVAVAVEPVAVGVVHARPQVVLVQRILHADADKSEERRVPQRDR